MRIVFLTLSSFSDYPSYKRAAGTGNALARMGHEVSIVALDCEENRHRLALEAPHCQAIYFKPGLLHEVVLKLKVLWQLRPDVVYSPSYSVHNLAGLRILFPWRMEYVVEFCELYSRYPVRRLNWALWETLALFEASHVLCASSYLAAHFEKVCKRLHLKRPMIASPYAYPDYLKPLGVASPSRKSIVFMASIARVYGVYEVLEAFKLLCVTRQDVQLDLIGGGPEKEAVKHWAEDQGLSERIIVHGFVAEEQINGYFSRAAVFVSPMHDTVQDVARCPSKLFYYLPYNKPIVTCALGNPREVLGEYGFYYRPSDVKDMAASFVRALDASADFSYPDGLIEAHSWRARAKAFEEWIEHA